MFVHNFSRECKLCGQRPAILIRFGKLSNSYMLIESLVLNMYCALKENQREQGRKYATFWTLHMPCHMIFKTACKEDIPFYRLKTEVESTGQGQDFKPSLYVM